MRIMFKRPAQFPMKDGKLSEVYAPDVEHDIDDKAMEQIQDSLLYKQLLGSGNAVPIKDTAPAAKAGKKADSEKNKDSVKEDAELPEEKQSDEVAEVDEGDPAVDAPAAKAGKNSAKKSKG